MLHLTICERDLLFERRFACRTLDLCVWNTTFSHRAVSPSSPFSFSSASLFLDCAAVGEGQSEYLLLCKKQAEVAFSWLRAQRKRLVFPAVSDCSRPAECKHALMCGAALDAADAAQAISAHEVWGLAWPSVPLFSFSLLLNSHPLSQAPYSPPRAAWNWYFTTPSACHKYN